MKKRERIWSISGGDEVACLAGRRERPERARQADINSVIFSLPERNVPCRPDLQDHRLKE